MNDTMQQAGPSRQLLTGTRAGYHGPIRWREGGHPDDTGRDPVLAVERRPRRYLNAAAASRPLRTGPLARCPGCGTPLDGGPVWYRCQACRRAVPAADVDTDYHLPAGSAAA